MIVQRFDSVTLQRADAVEVTAEGFALYDALFARADHIQNYNDGRGGIIREFRPMSEVVDSLASYELRPLVDLHPSRNLTQDNARMFARGATSAGRMVDTENGPHVGGRLAVWDRALNLKFERARDAGKPMQLSAGYTLNLDMTPGVFDGRAYDAIQRGMRINHVAAVPEGRAATAEVKYDAAGLASAWAFDDARALADFRSRADRPIFVDFGRWAHDAAQHFDATKFGTLLKRLSEEKSVSAESLGKAAGISSSTVSQIMRGEITVPPENRVRGFARALGVSFARLSGELPDKKDTMTIITKIDGQDVEVTIADGATTAQQLAAVAQAHVAAASAKDAAHKLALAEALDAFSPAFLAAQKKKKGEEEEKGKTKAKKDAADLLVADQRIDAITDAKTICGPRYDGRGKSLLAMRLDVVEAELGKPARAEIEALDEGDRAGAAALAHRQAVTHHADRPTRGQDLLTTIRSNLDKKGGARASTHEAKVQEINDRAADPNHRTQAAD